MFGGYWDDPDATSRVFAREGWLRTGRQGEVDALGRWRITGPWSPARRAEESVAV